MLTPTIHRNGSNSERMIDDAMETRHAVEVAIEKMRNVVPNGRDYYPQGDDAINTAMAEYRAMLGKLQSVSQELYDYAIAVQSASSR